MCRDNAREATGRPKPGRVQLVSCCTAVSDNSNAGLGKAACDGWHGSCRRPRAAEGDDLDHGSKDDSVNLATARKIRPFPQHSRQPEPAAGAGKSEWGTVAACLVPFLLYKVADLGLPYFWDEVAVYARGALYLHDHTLGLLPKHLPPELSRGHPLLLAFLVASAFRIFGPTPVVAHVFMLVLSTGLLCSVYWIGRRHWGHRAGLVAMVLLMVQPLFVAQSTLVLPEVALALACLWTLHGLALGRYRSAAVGLAIALFFKETALVLDLVVCVVLGLRWLRVRPSLRMAVAQSLPLLAANGVCASFFVVQKLQNGWFLFPEHVGYVDFHWPAVRHGLWVGAYFVFWEQGRLAVSAMIAVCVLMRGRWQQALRPTGLSAVLGVFAAGVLLFSAGNVFMKRYLLCLLPPLAIVGGWALVQLSRDRLKTLLASTGVVCLVSLSQLASSGFNCEYDMGFREAVRIQQQATEYVFERLGTGRAILANFPTYAGLEDPRFGYAPRRFERFMYEYEPGAEYIFASEIFERFEAPAGVETALVKRFSSPYMNIALYRILR